MRAELALQSLSVEPGRLHQPAERDTRAVSASGHANPTLLFSATALLARAREAAHEVRIEWSTRRGLKATVAWFSGLPTCGDFLVDLLPPHWIMDICGFSCPYDSAFAFLYGGVLTGWPESCACLLFNIRYHPFPTVLLWSPLASALDQEHRGLKSPYAAVVFFLEYGSVLTGLKLERSHNHGPSIQKT